MPELMRAMLSRIWVLPVLLSGLLLLPAALPSAALRANDVFEKSPTEFQIPVESLADALSKFGSQSGMQVVYAPDIAHGLKSRAVSGRLTIEAALKRLLQGTGLTWNYVNSDTVVLKKDAARTDSAAADQSRIDGARGGPTPQVTVAGIRPDSEQVTITGTRLKPYTDANVDIPRTINDTQPYYIFDAETIQSSGALNLEDFLKQRLTMNTMAQTSRQVTTTGTDQGGLSGNTSSINLRGVGSDKTLVLVNGRRMAGVHLHTTDLQPDLNGIPLSAIDRVEVLPSSASGIYGGNAIGGVLNVILKRDYSGTETRLSYDNTWDADSPRRTISLSYGRGLEQGRTHVSMNASFSDTDVLVQGDRRHLLDDNIAVIQRNSPTFLYNDFSPWLGSVPNIISATTSYTPVATGENGALGPFPPIPPYSSFGVTDELPFLLPVLAPLTLKNGVALGSPRTFIAPGTSANTSENDLYASLGANAGSWNLDLPDTTQAPTGLLRPFGAATDVRSLNLNVRRQMLPRLELFADFSYRENKSDSFFNPAIDFVRVPASAPSNPFAQTVFLSVPDARSTPVATESTVHSATLGAMAQLPRDWIGGLDYTWSESRFDNVYFQQDTSALQTGLASGTINPFVDTLQTPLTLDLQRRAFSGSNELHDITARAAGPLPALPWGVPSLTVGLEHRFSHTPERVYAEDISSDVTQSSVRKYYKRQSTTDSAYAEATLPLVKQAWLPLVNSFELQFAGRTERYQVDAGTPYEITYANLDPPQTLYGPPVLDGQPYFSEARYRSNNYTVGLKYQPLAEITLRASRATAFLPPTPDQLIRNPQPDLSPTNISDPVSGFQYGVQTLSGGNSDLHPQNSSGINVGLIWEPTWEALEGLRLNVEYYKIEQFDSIGSLGAQQFIDQETAYPQRVTRGPDGLITLVDTSFVNLYHRETSGWDFSADYSLQTRFGRFSLHAVQSDIKALTTQYALSEPEYDAAGLHPLDGGAAKHKTNGMLTWEWRRWTAGWSVQYTSSYKVYGAAGGPRSLRDFAGAADPYYIDAQGSDTVSSQIYHDLLLGYTFGGARAEGTKLWSLLSDLSLQMGIRNAFDKAPPLDVAYGTHHFLSPYGDIRLRTYWIAARKGF